MRQGGTTGSDTGQGFGVDMSGAVGVLIWLLGAAVFVWAWADPRFRDVEGSLEESFCLAASSGVALIALATGVIGRFGQSAFWLALAIVGQAAALQLIEAGPQMRYQHYPRWNRLFSDATLLPSGVIVVQAVLVTACLRRLHLGTCAWIRRTFRSWRLVGITAVFVLSSATVSHQIPAYVAEVVLAAVVQAVNLGNVILIAATIPAETLALWKQRLRALVAPITRRGGGGTAGVDRVALVAAVWIIVLSALLSVVSYQRHPHIPDEVAYLYQARFFAHGAVTMPAPPVLDAFDAYLMRFDGERWYPVTPPGWPLLAAVGSVFGHPWLVNPVLAGLSALLVFVLLRQLYDQRTARVAVLLLCVSPWNLFMAMNFMTHTSTLAAALAATVAMSRARKTGSAGWGALSGAATGAVSLIRPLDGLIVGGLLGLWAVGIGGRRLAWIATAGFLAGVVVVGAAVFPYNQYLTGDATRFPIMVYTDERFGPNSNAFGFGADRGMGWPIDPYPGHGPVDALVNANLNAFSINTELFGWSTGSLLIIAVMVFSGSLGRTDRLMIATMGAVFIVHFFYYFSGGPDFGARYWFLMIVPCIALAAGGIRYLVRRFEDTGTHGADRVAAAVLVLSFLTIVNYFPWRVIDKYHHYLGMRPDIRSLTEQHRFGQSLVLIHGKQYPDYASAFPYNPVDLQADAPVFAFAANAEVTAQLIEAYPERPIWVIDGPSVTSGAYRVIAGPISASELAGWQGRRPPAPPQQTQ